MRLLSFPGPNPGGENRQSSSSGGNTGKLPTGKAQCARLRRSLPDVAHAARDTKTPAASALLGAGTNIFGSRGTTLLESMLAYTLTAHSSHSPLFPGTELMARCPALR